MLCLDSHSQSLTESVAPRASTLLEGFDSGSEVDRVYAAIFDAVMDRRLLPGAKLTESALCAIFDCSRATVRGALAQLAHDKLVVLQPNRGAFVWQPTAKETLDVFEARQSVEGLLIDKLLTFSDLDERLEPLREMVRQERSAFERGDRISWLRLSNAFHVKLARLAGNHVLTELMHSLCSRTTLIIAYHDIPGASTCSYVEHEEILGFLEKRDAQGAQAAMRHHLMDCEHRMNDAGQSPIDPWSIFSIKR